MFNINIKYFISLVCLMVTFSVIAKNNDELNLQVEEGMKYMRGITVTKDLERGISLIKQAVDEGNASCSRVF